MNARTFAEIDSIRISPSRSAVQALRRGRLNADAITQLANSMRTQGVLEPILVRPVEKMAEDATDEYEIIAGERRWLAAREAGLATIPALIRDLDDAEALEVQLVENLHRDNLAPLEEAQGFAELMVQRNAGADEIAAMLGKSRSYVYARTKLLDLMPEVREALQAGKIDASSALVIARLPQQLHGKALAVVSDTEWSVRELNTHLRGELMADLAEAPFELTAKGLADRTACVGCPHNTDGDPELREAVGVACLDTACYTAKTVAFWDWTAKKHEAAGGTVIRDNGTPFRWYQWIRLDDTLPWDVQEEDVPDEITWRELFSGACIPAATLIEEDGAFVECLTPAQARDLASKLGKAKTMAYFDRMIEAQLSAARWEDERKAAEVARRESTGQGKAESEAAIKKAAEAAERERTYRRALLQKIHAKWKVPLREAELRWIAHMVACGDFPTEDDIDEAGIYAQGINPHKASGAELQRWLAMCTLVPEVHNTGAPCERLHAVAKTLRIDTKAVRAEVTKGGRK